MSQSYLKQPPSVNFFSRKSRFLGTIFSTTDLLNINLTVSISVSSGLNREILPQMPAFVLSADRTHLDVLWPFPV